MLQCVLDCDIDKKTILQLPGDEIERFLTLTHHVRCYLMLSNLNVLTYSGHLKVIDKKCFPPDIDRQMFEHNAQRILVELSENCGTLPSPLGTTSFKSDAIGSSSSDRLSDPTFLVSSVISQDPPRANI
jgi:hypothetical protein